MLGFAAILTWVALRATEGAALPVVVPTATFQRDNHAKRAAMGYAAAGARLRRAVLEAKSAAWDEEIVGWDEEDEKAAKAAQTAARELLAFATQVVSPHHQEAAKPALRGSEKEESKNGSVLVHNSLEFGKAHFGLKEKGPAALASTSSSQSKTESDQGELDALGNVLGAWQIKDAQSRPIGTSAEASLLGEVIMDAGDAPSKDDDDDNAGGPRPSLHYVQITHMVRDARNEIKAAAWDEDHEDIPDSSVEEEKKKVLHAAGKLVTVIAQVVSWAEAHMVSEGKTFTTTAAPTTTTTTTTSTTMKATSTTAATTTTSSPAVKAAPTTTTTMTTTTTTSKAAPSTTTTTTTSTPLAPKAEANRTKVVPKAVPVLEHAFHAVSGSSQNASSSDANKQAEVGTVESAAKAIRGAVESLDAATAGIRKEDATVGSVMNQMDAASENLENNTARIVLKVMLHGATENFVKGALEAEKEKQATANKTAPVTKKEVASSNVTQPVKLVNASIPKSFVKSDRKVEHEKDKISEEAKESAQEARDTAEKKAAEEEEKAAKAMQEQKDKEEEKRKAAREEEERQELKKEETEIEKKQAEEALKEKVESEKSAEQLEAEEKEAEEEMEADREERRARALMRLAKKRRAKLASKKTA